jgi:shikimate dehydrogenase
MDLVYNPLRTKLLKNAKKAGCKTIDGVGMLVHQGAVSLELWTGKNAPIEVMRDAVLQALGGKDR